MIIFGGLQLNGLKRVLDTPSTNCHLLVEKMKEIKLNAKIKKIMKKFINLFQKSEIDGESNEM